MVTPRVWINTTFATNYHFVRMLKDNPDGRDVTVLGTHPNKDAAFLAACDEIELEPDLRGRDYVDWALEKCSNDDVDVFFPRLRQLDVTAAADEFAAIGTVLAAPSAHAANLFEDKAAAYAALEPFGVPVPPHATFSTSEEFVAGVEALRASHSRLIMKPNSGMGAVGFRHLKDAPLDLKGLAWKSEEMDITYAEVTRILKEAEAEGKEAPTFMLMPHLDNPETSVDTLATSDGDVLSMLPRSKHRHVRMVDTSPEAESLTRLIHQHFPIGYLSNTQFRMLPTPDGPRTVLLEVNTRPSGGLYQGASSGVNLPWAAVQMALGQPLTLPQPTFPVRTVSLEFSIPVETRLG